MKTFISLLIAGCIFFWVIWMIRFQLDPYSNCVDHPNKKLSSKYFLCEPGGFMVKKGTLRKNVPTPWITEYPDLQDEDK